MRDSRCTIKRGKQRNSPLKNPAFENATRVDLETLQRKLYPRYYADMVEKYAKLYNVDTFLVAAMILEESRYNAAAVSWAGAIGLMQIMPATGRELAQQLKIRRFRTSMLKQPDVNIQMGTKYIGDLNSWFDDDPMLVIGAYNGGPGRMRRWVKSKNIKDIDEFVEKITIRETRLHIKKVIDSHDRYVALYGKTKEPPAMIFSNGNRRKAVRGFLIFLLNRSFVFCYKGITSGELSCVIRIRWCQFVSSCVGQSAR